MKLKKILALTLAVLVMISCFSFSAFAETDLNKDVQIIIKTAKSVIEGGKLLYNGEISVEEFLSHYAEDIARFDLAAADLTTLGGFNEFCQAFCGSSVFETFGIRDYFTSYSQHHGGGSESGRREFDMRGYGAVLYRLDSGGYKYQATYMDYGTLEPYSDYYNCRTHGAALEVYCSYSGNITERTSLNDFSTKFTSKCILYGDWRYKDGTPAVDNVTDNPIIPPTIEDPQDIDLYDFLNYFLDNLNFEYPDLSTVEGLLTSILNKLSTLDSDDDGALLAQINAAIISLANDSNNNNLQLIQALSDLKESINGGGSSADLQPILEQLEKMQKSLDYLCTINTLDVISDNWDKLTDTEKKFLDEYSAVVVLLIDKFGLAAVDNILTTLGTVIFNTNKPYPITVNMYGEDVTILSVDMFNDEAMEYIELAKLFVSVLLIFSFCLMMRKKLTGEGS